MDRRNILERHKAPPMTLTATQGNSFVWVPTATCGVHAKTLIKLQLEKTNMDENVVEHKSQYFRERTNATEGIFRSSGTVGLDEIVAYTKENKLSEIEMHKKAVYHVFSHEDLSVTLAHIVKEAMINLPEQTTSLLLSNGAHGAVLLIKPQPANKNKKSRECKITYQENNMGNKFKWHLEFAKDKSLNDLRLLDLKVDLVSPLKQILDNALTADKEVVKLELSPTELLIFKKAFDVATSEKDFLKSDLYQNVKADTELSKLFCSEDFLLMPAWRALDRIPITLTNDTEALKILRDCLNDDSIFAPYQNQDLSMIMRKGEVKPVTISVYWSAAEPKPLLNSYVGGNNFMRSYQAEESSVEDMCKTYLAGPLFNNGLVLASIIATAKRELVKNGRQPSDKLVAFIKELQTQLPSAELAKLYAITGATYYGKVQNCAEHLTILGIKL